MVQDFDQELMKERIMFDQCILIERHREVRIFEDLFMDLALIIENFLKKKNSIKK